MEASALRSVLSLIGTRVALVHGAGDEKPGYGGGGDLDCTVEGLDVLWPLRLGPSGRLINRLRYDVTATSWFVETVDGDLIIDTLDDPGGIGKYGFKTEGLAQDHLVATGPAAAYLALKRVRKGDLTSTSWEQVTMLALEAPEAFTSKLKESLPRSGDRLAEAVLSGQTPDAGLARTVMRDLRGQRLGSPLRAARYVRLQLGRAKDRLTQPTGLFVLVVGPDGAGKSALAEALLADHFGFRRTMHLHWRPGVLPAATAGEHVDHSRPHEGSRRGRAVSLAFVLYHWADHVLGSLLRIAPARRRSTLIVAERGWWDLGVDPHRYRLQVHRKLVIALGRLIAKPDLILRLDADPETIAQRKDEIGSPEVQRQLGAWRDVTEQLGGAVTIDVGTGVDESLRDAEGAVRDAVAARSLRALGEGWGAIRQGGRIRWWVPRGPRAIAAAPFRNWRPMTRSGALGWRVAGSAAASGLLRGLPRATPPREVLDIVGPHLRHSEHIAIAPSNHPGRYVALFISPGGDVVRVAKVVTTGGTAPLEREAEALVEMSAALPPPLRAPELLHHSKQLLVLEGIRSRPRGKPWHLPGEVAHALGVFARATGGAHGDCAPWNLLRAGSDWVLLDWEDAHTDALPFEDVFHYLVQGHALLGSPRADELIAAIESGRGWIGDALAAFARGAEVDLGLARSAFRTYLQASAARQDPDAPDADRALQARARLTELIDRS
jgi:thymidylate kinase